MYNRCFVLCKYLVSSSPLCSSVLPFVHPRIANQPRTLMMISLTPRHLNRRARRRLLRYYQIHSLSLTGLLSTINALTQTAGPSIKSSATSNVGPLCGRKCVHGYQKKAGHVGRCNTIDVGYIIILYMCVCFLAWKLSLYNNTSTKPTTTLKTNKTKQNQLQ